MNGQGRSEIPQRTPQPHNEVNYRGRNVAMRRSQESRRNFLWGVMAGGLGMLGITFAGKAFHLFPFGGDETTPASQGSRSLPGGDNGSGLQSNPGPGSATAPAQAGGSTGTATAIAQVNAVPTNSAVTFTIPSNSDPGVLIHLTNGKFVAFDATCTHAGCPVQYDSYSQHLLRPCHGPEFAPADAAAVLPSPTNLPLPPLPLPLLNPPA